VAGTKRKGEIVVVVDKIHLQVADRPELGYQFATGGGYPQIIPGRSMQTSSHVLLFFKGCRGSPDYIIGLKIVICLSPIISHFPAKTGLYETHPLATIHRIYIWDAHRL
jgi:hypothetical protein